MGVWIYNLFFRSFHLPCIKYLS